jgi:histone H2B
VVKVIHKGEKGKRKTKRNTDSFAFYIYKVIKQMYPDMGISRKAMSIMNSFVNDTYERITSEASKLVKWQHKRTLSSR